MAQPSNATGVMDPQNRSLPSVFTPGITQEAVMQGGPQSTDAATGVVYSPLVSQIADSAGVNVAGVDSSHNQLVKVNAALPAGSALIGGVNIVDSAGTNKAAVDAQHALLITDGGTTTIQITASSAGAIKTAAGRLCKVIVTTVVTSAVSIYDNTNAASGTVLLAIPTTAVVGTIYNVQTPLANGAYVGGGAGSPQILATFN